MLQWSINKLGVDEWIVQAVMALYKGSRATVKIGVESKKYKVKGSALIPFLFIMVLAALFHEYRIYLPWVLLC